MPIFFKLDLTDFSREYDIFPQEYDYNKMQETLTANKIDSNKHILIGLHLGCHGLSRKRTRLLNKFNHKKAWPIKNFIKLAKALTKHNPNIKIIITGSKQETHLATKFTSKLPTTINLVNQTSIHGISRTHKSLSDFH